MRPSCRRRPRRTLIAALGATLSAGLLSGCSGAGSDPGSPMGWMPQRDEGTGIEFALPPPASGPEEQQRSSGTAATAVRAYNARVGGMALSVQVLTTPEDPGAVLQERPPRRMPSVVIDQVQAEGEYEAEVLSNERVEGLDHPAYDARVELSAADEEAIWWLRSHALDDVVLVTQVVVFVQGGEREELESQGATAFDRLNGTVEIPPGLTG